MSVRKSTVKRVKSFLQDLQEGCESRDITNLRETVNFYGLSGGSYSPILRAMGLVKKEGRNYYWASGKVTKKVAKTAAELVNEYAQAGR